MVIYYRGDVMEINSVSITYCHMDSFKGVENEGSIHIKTVPLITIVQATEGNYDIQLGSGNTFNTNDNGFFITPSNVTQTITHHVDKTTGKMSARWVFLSVSVNGTYSFDDLFNMPIILEEPYKTMMNSAFDKLFSSNNAFEKHNLYSEILNILSKASPPKEAPFPICIDDSIVYIKNNYMNKIGVNDLSKAAKLSPSRFYSVFKKQMGVSPISYLNSYRMSVASEMLINTDISINEVSYNVGINDPVYFCKMFKKTFSQSPGKFREIYSLNNNTRSQK